MRIFNRGANAGARRRLLPAIPARRVGAGAGAEADAERNPDVADVLFAYAERAFVGPHPTLPAESDKDFLHLDRGA